MAWDFSIVIVLYGIPHPSQLLLVSVPVPFLVLPLGLGEFLFLVAYLMGVAQKIVVVVIFVPLMVNAYSNLFHVLVLAAAVAELVETRIQASQYSIELEEVEVVLLDEVCLCCFASKRENCFALDIDISLGNGFVHSFFFELNSTYLGQW